MAVTVKNSHGSARNKQRDTMPPALRHAIDTTRIGQQQGFGWPGYVVPAAHLKPWLERIRDDLLARFPDDQPNNIQGEGWLAEFSANAANILGSSQEAIIRRVYAAMHGEARIMFAEMAGGILLAHDIDLDRDTDIPTLPGNKWDCFDLLQVRAEAYAPELEPMDLLPMIPTVLSLSAAIIETPELTSHLQDDAPFDCLRPWR